MIRRFCGCIYCRAILVQRVGDECKHASACHQEQRVRPEVSREDTGNGYTADSEEHDEVAAYLHPADKAHNVAIGEAQESIADLIIGLVEHKNNPCCIEKVE